MKNQLKKMAIIFMTIAMAIVPIVSNGESAAITTNWYTPGISQETNVMMSPGSTIIPLELIFGPQDQDRATYTIEPDSIISTTEDPDTADINDDWAFLYGAQEYEIFTLEKGEKRSIVFELSPPEDVPLGEYEFVYRIYPDSDSEQYDTLIIKVNIS